MPYIYYSITNEEKSTFRPMSQECSVRVKEEWDKDLGYSRIENTNYELIKRWADKKGYKVSFGVLVADVF